MSAVGLAEGRTRVVRGAAAGARSVARAVRPVRAVVGPVGWLTAAGLVVAATASLRWGWIETWSVTVTLAVLVLVAVAFVVGRSSYAVDLDLARRRVVVGERAVGRIEVRNASRRPLLPARIELPVGSGLATFQLPRLAGGAVHEDLFTIPTTRRCVLSVGPVVSVRGDALGLLRRQVRWTDPVDLYVHPRTISLDGASSGFLRDIEGLPTQDLSSNDVAFHALREYVPGDDRRTIHWKTTARMGRLMVRQFEETRRSHLAVALSTSVSDYGDAEELELATSVCGSLGLQAIREEKQLTVLVPSGALRTATATRFLDALCEIELAGGDDIVALARVAGSTVPDASVTVLVTGSAVTPAQLRTAASHLPLGVVAVAVRCVPGADVSRRSIGELTVLTVGALAELPRVMRRVGM